MATVITLINQPAWDADARSIATLPRDGEVTFCTNDCVGVVCGLSSNNATAGYELMTHGLLIRGDRPSATVLESGGGVSPLAAYPWRYPNTTVYRITRLQGVVRYYVDQTLIYTSTVPSLGPVFVDCSLYAYGDAILDLTVTPWAADRIEGVLPPLMGRMLDQAGDVCLGLLPALVGWMEPDSTDRLQGDLPSLFGQMTDLVGGILQGELPPLQGRMTQTDAIRISDNRIEGTLPALVGQMAEGHSVRDGISGELPPLRGRMLDQAGDVLVGSLPSGTVLLRAQEQDYGLLQAPAWRMTIREWAEPNPDHPLPGRMVGDLSLPLPRLVARLSPGPYVGGQLALPLPRLTAYAGAQAALALPLPHIDATLRPAFGLIAQLALPLPHLAATLRASARAQAHLLLPLPGFTAYAGTRSALSLPLPQITATLHRLESAHAQLLLPLPHLAASLTGGSVAAAQLLLPLPQITAYGGASVTLVLPLPQLSAVPTDPDSAPAAVWLINVRTGAITTAHWGAFDRLVTAHGRLYGLRAGQLHTLDAANPVPMTLRFASQDFGTGLLKSCTEVYLQCRDAQGVILTVISDETTHYTYTPPLRSSPSYGSQKVSVGKGLRFHTLGLIVQNREGGPFDLGGMELLIVPTSRRPR